MALEGTHIRLAADLQEQLAVQDAEKFFSGTIYPDSRYCTKIDRSMTHNKDFVNREFINGDDFRKGWVLHLVGDRAQKAIFDEEFGDLFPDEPLIQGSDHWVSLTALKMLQDMNDVTQFPVQNYLPLLSYGATPNGENRDEVLAFSKIFQEAYADSKNNTLAMRARISHKLSTDPALFEKLHERAQEYQSNKVVVEKVFHIYQKMRTNVETILRKVSILEA